MTGISFGKKKLSIAEIGPKRFWLGLVIGLFYTVILSLLINYFRESLRYMTGIDFDLFVWTETETLWLNLYFGAFSSVIGLSMALWIWLSNHKHHRKTDKLFKNFAQSQVIFFLFVVLWVFQRFSSMLNFTIYSYGDDGGLKLNGILGYTGILLLIFLFMQNWLIIKRIYRLNNWFWYSLAACIALTFILSKTTSVNPERVNKVYEMQFAKEYEYLEEQLESAQNLYGISFGEQTVENLKKWETAGALKLVNDVSAAFRQNQKISMDTLILQKIIIHNRKRGGQQYEFEFQWYYAVPGHILYHIKNFPYSPNEMDVLFEILSEEIILVNRENDDQVNNFQNKVVGYFFSPLNYNLINNQILQVLEELNEMPEYSERVKLLSKPNVE